jgi:hypothetical protein
MTTTRTPEYLIARLDRTTRNLAAVLRRRDSGQTTGRNSDATDATIRYALQTGRELVTELCETDATEAQIARPIDYFWQVERRALGIR